MRFELTDALIDDLLFTMENQEGIFFLDTQEGMVISEDDEKDAAIDEERFIGIPEWDSSDGYHLMEQFAAGFKNPVIRQKLTAALDRGKGVFRAFKDVLTHHPEAEQLWYSCKEHAMKKVILRWYNALRAEWGLEGIGAEPEETEDLVREDFRFREPLPADAAAAAELHQLCLEESPAKGTGVPWLFPGSLSLVAETGKGDFAAYINADPQDQALAITALEVRPEYRGLGIGEILLTRLLEKAEAAQISEILIDIPQRFDGFSRVLLRESFAPYAIRYSRPGKNL
jgi:GNAT superfamily N-acetyltransferase